MCSRGCCSQAGSARAAGTPSLAAPAEPEADDRKLMGAKFMFALSLVAVQAVYYKRWMWSPIKARRLVVNAVH